MDRRVLFVYSSIYMYIVCVCVSLQMFIPDIINIFEK